MSASRLQAAKPPADARPRLVQRTCKCGGTCEECRRKKRRDVQAKLRLGESGGRLEREADQVATQVLSDAPASAQSTPAVAVHRVGAGDASFVEAPPPVERAVAVPGRALDGSTRAFFEGRFGHDFSRVRVHDDAHAAGSARAIGALAYTAGHHLVFGASQYRPHSRDGRTLIAHELTHVLQQGHGAPTTVRRKDTATTATAVWYQEAIDQLAAANARMAEQRKRGEFAWVPFYEVKKNILELCEAVDRKDVKATKEQLEKRLKGGGFITMQSASYELLKELSGRMFEMGLEDEYDRLQRHLTEESGFGPDKPHPHATGRYLDFAGRLISGAAARPDSPEALTESMRRFARAFVVIRNAYMTIDMEAAEFQRRTGAGSRGFRGGTALTQLGDVRAVMKEWLKLWNVLVEQAIDAAVTDLGSAAPTGSGAAMLKALRASLAGDTEGALFPETRGGVADAESFEITETKIEGKGQGEIRDAFDPDDKARRVPVTTYDPEQEWARELQGTVASSVRTRSDQVQVLGRLYGVIGALQPREKILDTVNEAEQAADTGDSVRRAGGLKLHSDDDWRRFLLQKYRDLTTSDSAVADERMRQAMTPAEALEEIVAMLFAYMSAFTVHARFTNLYDVGVTPYFNRPFPRSLTGQLVHDCGVYAMRAAYMLSLVREELGLKFYFVRLPAHVSLVINGERGSTLPTFLVENNHYQRLSANYLEDRRQQWESFQDPATDQMPSEGTSTEQFVGELAAGDFIGGPLDMPMRVTEVPRPVGDAKAQQQQLWTFYRGKAMEDVFGPSSSKKGDRNYLFHQRYLELTEQMRMLFNETTRPFWNVEGPKAWSDFERALTGSGEVPRTDVSVAELMAAFGRYKAVYFTATAPLRKAIEDYQKKERDLSKRLRDDPNLAGPGIRFSAGVRAAMLFRYPWEWYDDTLATFEVSFDARDPKSTEPIENVKKNAGPPWVPTPEKSLRRLD